MPQDSGARKHFKIFEVVGSPQGSEFLLHSGSRSLCAPLPDENEALPRERKRRAEACEFSDVRDARPRAFDPILNCWVLPEPPRDHSRDGRRRARRLPVSIPDRSGNWWWVGCPVTGRNLIRIERYSREAAMAEAQRLFPRERFYLKRDGQHRQGALQAALMSIVDKC